MPEEIGRSLSADIRSALAYAFERSPEDIREYLEENFTLAPEHIIAAPIVEVQTVVEPDDDGVDQVAKAALGDAETFSTEDFDPKEDEPATQPTDAPSTGEPDRELIETEVATKPHTAPKPQRPNVMARFAFAQGYKADGNDRFFHADGSWIGRADGKRYPWERRSAAGEVLRHYYPKDHCLEHEPLQLEADIWGLLDQKPDLYSFILINPEGGPVEMTGARLRTLRDGGDLTIHPATYRLIYDLDD